MTVIEQRRVGAGGVEFCVLSAGRGDPVVLLHGFPDSAWTWEAQLRELAERGYAAFAPFLPGYPPTALPPGEGIDIDRVVEALAALVEELADGPAALVGHDWGATLTYALCARFPDAISQAMAVAVPHPSASGATLEHPALIQENFHHWLFQLEAVPEATLRMNDFALVDFLWESWTTSFDEAAHVARVKSETLAQPGCVEAAVEYYRSLYRALTSGTFALPDIAVPTLVVFGSDDPHHVLAAGQERWFRSDHRLELVEGARHFVHREQPQRFNDLLVDWVGAA